MALCLCWFLVEIDDGQSNGQKTYIIKHFSDLDNKAYINRKVYFRKMGSVIKGNVIFGCDDNTLAEQHLITLIERNKEAKVNQDDSKNFLVQYYRDAHTLVHKILRQGEIILPENKSENSIIKEVLKQDDEIHKFATVLHVNDSEELMQTQLNELKTICSKKVFEMTNNNHADNEETPWLLVQYTSGPQTVFYSIVHIKTTVMKKDNKFPYDVTYLYQDDVIYQAIILCRCHSYYELIKQLRSLKDTCSNLETIEG